MEFAYVSTEYELYFGEMDKLTRDLGFVVQVLKEALELVQTKLVESKTNHALNDELAHLYQVGIKKISTYVQVVLQFLRAPSSSQKSYYDSPGVGKSLSLLLYSLAEIERCMHSSAVYASSSAISKVEGTVLDVDDNCSVLMAYRFLLRDFSFCLDLVQIAFNLFIFAKLGISENSTGQETGQEINRDIAQEFCKSQPLSLFEWSERSCRPVLKQCFLELGQQVLQHPFVSQVVKEAAKEDIQNLCEELNDVKIDPGRLSQQTQSLEEPSAESGYSLPPKVDYKDVQVGVLLGEGSFGSVYRCKWKGKDMVVKIIQLDPREPKIQEKFEMEVSILSSLKHPNAVQIFGFGFTEANGNGFIIMEHMEMDLSKIIRECDMTGKDEGSSVFPIDVSMHLMLQIVEGMCAMKERRVMHRDLKPANILLNRPDKDKKPSERFYELKLADFGTSKQSAVFDSNFHTRRVGTVAYMAPEVMSEVQSEETKSEGYSWKADVWSFGMVCFEILTGKRPFDRENRIRMIIPAVQSGERPKLDLLHCKDPLRILVEDCWKLSPKERPDILEVRRRLWKCRIWHFFQVASPPTSWQPFLTNLHLSYTKSLTLPVTERIEALKTAAQLIVGPCCEAVMALRKNLESIKPFVEKTEVQLQEIRKRFSDAKPDLETVENWLEKLKEVIDVERVENWLEKLKEVIDVASILVHECNKEPKLKHKSSTIPSSEVLKSMQPAFVDRIAGMELNLQELCKEDPDDKLGLQAPLLDALQVMKKWKEKHGACMKLQEKNSMIESGDQSSYQLPEDIMAQNTKIAELSKEQETLALLLENYELHAFLRALIMRPGDPSYGWRNRSKLPNLKLSNLQTLNLHLNKLSSLPPSIGELRALRTTDVHFNKLRGLPATIGNLTNLAVLDCSSNLRDLAVLPDSIGDLVSLRDLDLSFKQISELPISLGRLTNLKNLKLDENPLMVPPMEVVEQGHEALRESMAKLWSESLKSEEEKNLAKSLSFGRAFQSNSGGEEWLPAWAGGSLVNSWLGKVQAGGLGSLPGGKPSSPRSQGQSSDDSYLEQQL